MSEGESGTTGDGSADETSGNATNGKYLLIQVPNYKADAAPADQQSSYLRLGAQDLTLFEQTSWPKASGEDLARKAAVPRLDVGGRKDGIWDKLDSAEAVIFEDDDRQRDGAPHFTEEAERVKETDRIGIREPLSAGFDATRDLKGGWRDHTDGDRITTTRGDKVEVIGGNYKLVVLGRQDDPRAAVAFDFSGGHIRTSTINRGDAETTKAEWDGDHWEVTEKAGGDGSDDGQLETKGDSYERYLGDLHEYFSGLVKYEETGSDAPTVPRPNPVITEKTWATSVSEYKGSSACPIPSIYEETWAGSITEKTTAGTMNGVTEVGAKAGTTLVGAKAETTIAGGILDVKVAPLMIEAAIGNKTELFAGAKLSFELSAAFSLTLGVALEMAFGPKTDLYNGHDEMDDLGNEVTALNTEVKSLHTEITDVADELTGVDTDLHEEENRLAELNNDIAAEHVYLTESLKLL